MIRAIREARLAIGFQKIEIHSLKIIIFSVSLSLTLKSSRPEIKSSFNHL